MNIAMNPRKFDARLLKTPAVPRRSRRLSPSCRCCREAGVTAAPDAPVRPAVVRVLEGLAPVALLAAASYWGYEYWALWQSEVTTDDAYVQADLVTIAPQVSGYLTTVNVTDNQPVRERRCPRRHRPAHLQGGGRSGAGRRRRGQSFHR